MFRDCRAWCWGRHLFQEGKPLEVKHFCSKLLQRSSENMLGWSTAVILGAEHQVHKNSSGRQVASFQHAKYCSSTVSHPSFCILIHSYIYISLYIYICISKAQLSAICLGKIKERGALRYLRPGGVYQSSAPEFSSGDQSPSVSSFTLSWSINITSYLHCEQGQHN